MFPRYLTMPYTAPPDTGAGGGAAGVADNGAAAATATDAGAADAGDADAGDVDDADPDAHAAGADDDADLTDDEREREELLASLPVDQREKRARTWNRRASRQLRQLQPIAEVFRASDGRFMPREEIERIRHDAEDMRELNQFFDEHPDLVQTILERRRGGGARRETAPSYTDPFANEEQLPFDMTAESSRFLVQHLRDGHKTTHDLRQELAQIKQMLTGLGRETQSQRASQVEDRWKTATLQAAAGLDGTARQQFVNSVWKTFELAKARNILGRINLNQVLERELKPFAGARRRQIADTARRANHATTVPRPAGRGSTTAAAATDTNRSAGTIKDARKSLFTRLGMQAPPR